MIFAHPPSSDLPGLFAWARRLIDDMNRFLQPIDNLPVFVDDAAAEAGQLKVGQGYVTPDGTVRRRMA